MYIEFFQKSYTENISREIIFTDPKNNNYYEPFFVFTFTKGYDGRIGIAIKLDFVFVDEEHFYNGNSNLKRVIVWKTTPDFLEVEFLVVDLDDVIILLSDFFKTSIDNINISKNGFKIGIDTLLLSKEEMDEDAVFKLRLSSLSIRNSYGVVPNHAEEDEIIRKFRQSSLVQRAEKIKKEQNVFSKYVRFPG